MASNLIGYIRKSKSGNALKFSVSVKAFDDANKYKSKDGDEYVGLVANIDHVKEVMEGDKEVTSLNQITE